MAQCPGVQAYIYLDDFLFVARRSEDLLPVPDMIKSLGFTINVKKSQLTPVRQLTYVSRGTIGSLSPDPLAVRCSQTQSPGSDSGGTSQVPALCPETSGVCELHQADRKDPAPDDPRDPVPGEQPALPRTRHGGQTLGFLSAGLQPMLYDS